MIVPFESESEPREYHNINVGTNTTRLFLATRADSTILKPAHPAMRVDVGPPRGVDGMWGHGGEVRSRQTHTHTLSLSRTHTHTHFTVSSRHMVYLSQVMACTLLHAHQFGNSRLAFAGTRKCASKHFKTKCMFNDTSLITYKRCDACALGVGGSECSGASECEPRIRRPIQLIRETPTTQWKQ